MAWEWVAPVATAGAGIAGMYFTWLTGKQSREHAEEQLTQKLQHDREAGLEDRRQQRIADTYYELLGTAERIGHWAATVRPVMDTDPPMKPYPLPDVETQAAVEARVGAFASAEVREQMELWRSIVKEIQSADRVIGMALARVANGDPTSIKYHEMWERLDTELRAEEREERRKLTTLVADELGSRPGI